MVEEFMKKKERKELKAYQIECPDCKETLDNDELLNELNVCYFCGYHFRLNARERMELLVDPGSFEEYDSELTTFDYLNFPDYTEKVKAIKSKTSEKEGLISGKASFNGEAAIICVMNPDFLMGSMGAVVGEKITRAVEKAITLQLPVVIFSSSGGARMQEGIVSLMQMAKTSAALGKLDRSGGLYISVLTDPTTGGVTASFSMLGDLNIAEPNALIGFAGPRVIEQTIRQTLPEGFQKSEFLKEKGFLDKIIDRREMTRFLGDMIALHR